MREKFWAKLKREDRKFKWFHDNYIKDKITVKVKYNTLYQQAGGVFMVSMDEGLRKAIMEYLKG